MSELSGTLIRLPFPKRSRILKTREFRRVYDNGERFPGPLFVAFCLKAEPDPGAEQLEAGSRIGFTVPRALGKAVVRNRIRRRVREAFRVRMPELGPNWLIVINPRRRALDAPFEELKREVEKVVQRCAKS